MFRRCYRCGIQRARRDDAARGAGQLARSADDADYGDERSGSVAIEPHQPGVAPGQSGADCTVIRLWPV